MIGAGFILWRNDPAAAFLSTNAVELDANPLGLPIGSQIYPLRSMLKDFPAFVKMMAGIGVTRLELCSPNRLDTGEFKVLVCWVGDRVERRGIEALLSFMRRVR